MRRFRFGQWIRIEKVDKNLKKTQFDHDLSQNFSLGWFNRLSLVRSKKKRNVETKHNERKTNWNKAYK